MKNVVSLCFAVLLLAILPIYAIAAEIKDEPLQKSETAFCKDNAPVEVCEEEKDIFTYHYDAAQGRLVSHILNNNSGVSNDEALLIANRMIEKTRAINESLITAQSCMSIDENSICAVYYLGRISNGKLVEETNSYTSGFDQMIPGDWVSKPTRTKHILTVKYSKTWLTCDSFTSSAGASITASADISVSLELGWTATGGLTKSVAKNLGISVTPTSNAKAQINIGYELDANPWTKTAVTPYIYYYVDTYSGVRGFHCFNSLTGEYFYMTAEVYGQDINLQEVGIRTWSRENFDKDPYALHPDTPESWEW